MKTVERPHLRTVTSVCVVWLEWRDWRGARIVGASARPPRRARRWCRRAPRRPTQRSLTHTTRTQLNEWARGNQTNTAVLVPLMNLGMTTFSTPSYEAPFAPGSPVYYPARWLKTLCLLDIHPCHFLPILSSCDPTQCRDVCHGHCHGTQMISLW